MLSFRVLGGEDELSCILVGLCANISCVLAVFFSEGLFLLGHFTDVVRKKFEEMRYHRNTTFCLDP